MKKNENTNTKNIMKSVKSTILILAICISASMSACGAVKSNHISTEKHAGAAKEMTIVEVMSLKDSADENKKQSSAEMWDEMMMNVNSITNAL